MEEKIAGDELNVVQGLYHELQMVQAKLQGALSVLAAIYQIPEGGSIDPLTGEIKRPQPKQEAE